MNAYEMTAAGVGIAMLVGLPVGWLTWRFTHSRFAAIATGLTIAVVAVVIAAWTYYTRVLCPPGAGCV